MSNPAQRLSFREKAGYALGDAATNFFFQAMILYQGRFYTDVMGLSSSAVAWLFLIVRGWDAIFDPLVGTLADRTNSRWGKFRPWILWTAVPYGLVLWSAYTVPGFAGSTKVIYAYVTYVLLMMFYSANNTPYSALNGVMTGDVNERTSLAQYRFVAAMSAQLVVQGFTLPLVDKFGGGNVAKGWSITFAIFGGLVILFSLIAFLSSRERVRPDPAQKVSLRQDVAGVFKCRPWVAMFLLTIFVFTTLALRGTSMYYYFTYFVDKAALLDFVRSFGLGTIVAGHGAWWKTVLGWFGFILTPDGSNASSVGFSLFNIAGTIVTIIGVLTSKWLSERFGKKAVFGTGLALTTLITMAIVLVPATAVWPLFVLSLLWPAAYGPTIPLLWAMIADVADYSEWQTGRRATGFVYAGIVFALKAGLGVGGALANGIIGAYGYVANVAQSEQSLRGIQLSATVYAGIPFALGVLCMFFYPITKELNLRIGNELAERRKKFATE
ncbi:MAG: MFS transporter [Opitutaceae bacterium]|jgi:Na+/melibiose symporter-like transporter